MHFDSMPEYRGLNPDWRRCYFPDEFALKWHTNYSEPNCVTECTWSYASEECQCIPWFLVKYFPGFPVCELYGNKCFRTLIDNRYDLLEETGCSEQCLDDCNKLELTSRATSFGYASTTGESTGYQVYKLTMSKNVSPTFKNLSSIIP